MKKNERVLIFICVLSLAVAPDVLAASKAKKIKAGSKLYKKNQFQEAALSYQEALQIDPNSDVANYDLGTALYKAGNYENAVEPLSKALLTPKKDLKQKSHYNLGNVFYKMALGQEAFDLQQAVEDVERGINNYDKAIELKSDDQDAVYNQKIAKKELERLKKELEKQKKQQKQNQNSQKEQSSQDQSQDQNSKDQQSKSQSNNQSTANNQSGDEKKNEGQQSSQQQNPSEKDKDQSPKEKDGQSQDQQARQKDGQKQKDKENQKKDKSENSSKNESGQTKPEDASQKAAEMTLDDYEINEAPKGLLNFVPHAGDEKPVAKDW